MLGRVADPAPLRTPPAGATRTAAFFDLDKTIIAKSSTLAFSRSFYQGGLINRRAVLRSAYAQFVYLAGGADHDQMERMRAYLSSMATGWDVEHRQPGETPRDPGFCVGRYPVRLARSVTVTLVGSA